MRSSVEGALEIGAWDRFWFLPSATRGMRPLRVGFGALGLVYFLSHFADIARWFGPGGLLPAEMVGRLMGEGFAWRFSPLYLAESPEVLRGFLLLGMAAAAACIAGFGGRLSVGLLLLGVLSVVHRGPMIAGLAEIPLCFGLLYLVLQPGPPIGRRPASSAPPFHWTATVARRLMQLHLTAILLATVASQLAGNPWWNGEGVLYLVLPAGGETSALAWLGDYPLLAAGLTHLMILVPAIGVLYVWIAGRERHGALLLWGYLAAMAVLSGQILYAAGLATAVLAFWPAQSTEASRAAVPE